MQTTPRLALPICCLLLAACGSTSRLKTDSPRELASIGDFALVEVVDFASTASSKAKNEDDTLAHAESVEQARQRFADLIAEELGKRAAFDEVSREELDGEVLQVGGTITRYEEGNVAARMVTGFVGQAHFEATVEVRDKASGRVLGRFDVDRNSWPLPIGASSNAVQNTGMFMSGAAKRIADELAKARERRAPGR